MMSQKRVLNIITESFPFGNGEQFFEAEVHEMAKHFDEVVLFPLSTGKLIRKLPLNVSIKTVLAEKSRVTSKKLIFKNFGLIAKIIGHELIHAKQRFFVLKNLKRWMSTIVQCQLLGQDFKETINEKDDNYFYSFWMNDGALMLAILSVKSKINKFSFRVNGYDIFNERHEANYLPFRSFNYKHVDHIFVLSNGALTYLKGLNNHPEKMLLAHYGIYSQGLNTLNESENIVRIVSCANVIPLKRIDKIINALSFLTAYQVEWIHFGDGELMSKMKELASELPQNIKVDFRGNRPNTEVLEVYKNQSVNLFVHTSETEGLGMAIVEAQSFGIPAVVIGVGGVVDIVTNETGRILSPDSEGEQISLAMCEVLESDLNRNSFRKIIQAKCLAIFNAEANYKSQYNRLINKGQ